MKSYDVTNQVPYYSTVCHKHLPLKSAVLMFFNIWEGFTRNMQKWFKWNLPGNKLVESRQLEATVRGYCKGTDVQTDGRVVNNDNDNN